MRHLKTHSTHLPLSLGAQGPGGACGVEPSGSPCLGGPRPTVLVCACMPAESLQSCPTLRDPLDCSLLGSPVLAGISQARTLEWVAVSFSREAFPTQGSNPHLLCHLHWWAGSFTTRAPREALWFAVHLPI